MCDTCYIDCCCSPCYRKICVKGERGFQGPKGDSTNGLAAYGGLYNADNKSFIPRYANVYEEIELNTPMPSQRVTAANNKLIIENDGDYEINYNLLLGVSAPLTATAAVRRNGTIIPSAITQLTFSLPTESTPDNLATRIPLKHTASIIVKLYKGDELDLALAVNEGIGTALNIIIYAYGNASLTVKKLNDANN